eukprot:scaffold10270_cov417-Chaetoceros_neogracile.AAC.20
METNIIAPNGRISPLNRIPGQQQDDFGHESLIHSLAPGRLVIKRMRASDIGGKASKLASVKSSTYNPSLKFTLGTLSTEPLVHSTRTLLDTDENPSFGDDVVNFDIQDATTYTRDTDICLKIEIINKHLLRYDVIGVIEVSVVKFLAASQPQREEFPVRLVDENSSQLASLLLDFHFYPVKEGLLSVSINELSQSLPFKESNGAPFEITLGDQKRIAYEHDVLYITIDKSNWFQNLIINISAKESDTNRVDVIGVHSISFLSNICDQYDTDTHTGYSTQAHFVSALHGHKIHIASATVLLTFMQAGLLKMNSIRGSLMNNTSTMSSSGIQLVIKSKGRGSALSTSSSIFRYEIQNSDLIWNDTLQLSCVDNQTICLELYRLDALDTCYELIGSGEISLFPLYREGSLHSSVLLHTTNEVGMAIERAEIKLSLEFAGNGLAYPKFHPSPSIVEEDAPSAKVTLLNEEVVGKHEHHASDTCHIFSDKDIKDSFKFLDLDKNGFISASELRHALICMGELVTDEEIDTMIDILDLDGDGQANFHQFRRMAKSSDLTFMNSSNLPKKKEDSNHSDLDYNVNRDVLSGFVLNNKISKHTINVFRKFLRQRRNAKLSEVGANDTNVEIFHINCSSLCRHLAVHSTGESHRVFDLMKVLVDDNEYADARRLILGLANFIPTFSVPERCQMILELYDDSKLGCLSVEDLKRVLAANHMRTIKEVEKKSQTIMKFIDSKGSGKLRQEDIQNAATKFPNLLFPRHVGKDSL